MYVLGILARAGHGKTTVANHLRDKYDARIVSFAGALKRCAKKVMDFSDAQLYGTQAEKEQIDDRYGFSARHFLQKLGTEGLREEFGADIHMTNLIRTLREMDEQEDRDHLYIVDDVRFVNEAEFLATSEDFHGAVIRVRCTDAPDTAGAHVSEKEIDQVPTEILAADVVSSRALGTADLISKVEWVIDTFPKLAPIRRLIKGQRAA